MQGDRGKPTDCFSWIWGQVQVLNVLGTRGIVRRLAIWELTSTSQRLGQEIMKHVALQRYLICDRQELPVSYVKQAEKQLKHLVTLIGPNDGDNSYFVNQHAPTHRTIYEDLVVQKYLKRKKLQATSFKLQA